jgi:hypothetical protein
MWKQCQLSKSSSEPTNHDEDQNNDLDNDCDHNDNDDVLYCVNEQKIRLSSIKNELLSDIGKSFLRSVSHFKSVNLQYAEYLSLKYLVLFDPGNLKSS